MRKFLAFLLVLIMLLPCVSGCINNKSYTVTVIPDYMRENDLKESYLPGEKVTVKASNVTENYYTFILNGIEYKETDMDDSYTYFTFTMLAENVIVEIKENGVDIPEAPRSFSKFLNNENFVHGINQTNFKKQMKDYSYNGEPITEIIVGCYDDDEYGGGYSASGERFGFENRYRANDAEGYNDYYNSFYTKVELDGLSIPYSIKFTDTLDDAIGKIGISFDFENNHNKNENSSISLYRVPVANDSGEYDYVIEYTETYNITNEINEKTEVTRTVRLLFKGEQERLDQIYVKVNERRETKQDTSQN